MKNFVILSALIALTACSGGRDRGSSSRGARGDISSACLIADRASATPVLCECVQRVANSELSSRDRTRVASFMIDPEVANETRISNTDSDDAFWARYRAFITSARRQCS